MKKTYCPICSLPLVTVMDVSPKCFRNVLGTKCLAEILSEREQIAHWMETTLDEATVPWGVKVERVEM